MSSHTAGKTVVFLLRFLGINGLLALIFLVMPFSWIEQIHNWSGLGDMPDAPIVRYLTRSICLFYALFGSILIMISLDLVRYRRLVWFTGMLFPLIGIILLGVDIIEKLPLSWILSEGPFMIVFGLLFLWLLRIMDRED